MRIVVQRCNKAQVSVDNKLISQIEKGLLLLIAISAEDNANIINKIAEKLVKLRIFTDHQGKMNLSIKDVSGEILAISQFTLYADLKHGNRPSFSLAAPAQHAKLIYDHFCEKLKNLGITVKKGIFAAHMQVELVNDGPVTILIDSEQVKD